MKRVLYICAIAFATIGALYMYILVTGFREAQNRAKAHAIRISASGASSRQAFLRSLFDQLDPSRLPVGLMPLDQQTIDRAQYTTTSVHLTIDENVVLPFETFALRTNQGFGIGYIANPDYQALRDQFADCLDHKKNCVATVEASSRSGLLKFWRNNP
jgi:hypothetical protein